MFDYDRFEHWSLKQVHERLEEAYGSHENREMIIAAAPNRYGVCEVFYLSLNGSPPRAHALYWVGVKEFHVMNGHLTRKRRVNHPVSIPELDKLVYEIGFYSYDPEKDHVEPYQWRGV